jgi:hypothetical protein
MIVFGVFAAGPIQHSTLLGSFLSVPTPTPNHLIGVKTAGLLTSLCEAARSPASGWGPLPSVQLAAAGKDLPKTLLYPSTKPSKTTGETNHEKSRPFAT